MNLTVIQRIALSFIVFPVLWLSVYLTQSTVKTIFSFEANSETAQGAVVAADLGKRCFQPSGGRLNTCSQVLHIEYRFEDGEGVLRTDYETVDFWFRSEADYAQELIHSTPKVTYDKQNPTESTLFSWRKRGWQIFNVLFSAFFFVIGLLGLKIIFRRDKLHVKIS